MAALDRSPSSLGRRCKVVKTTSVLPLLRGPFLCSHGPAVLKPSRSAPLLDLIDEWPFPLLSISSVDLVMVNAESCNAPSTSSLLGLSSRLSTRGSLSSSFPCSSEPSGLFGP